VILQSECKWRVALIASTHAEPCGGVAELLVHDLGDGIDVLGEEVEVLSHGCRGHRYKECRAKHGDGLLAFWGIEVALTRGCTIYHDAERHTYPDVQLTGIYTNEQATPPEVQPAAACISSS
jgi:hypothetical protein